MTQSTITLDSEPVGSGRERTCYVHPVDSSKLIKVCNSAIVTQTNRELVFYRELQSRSEFDYSHVPRFYGQVETSRGAGIVVDLVRDRDGGVSRSMRWYLKHGTPIQTFEPYLDELKSYLLQNLVIFNHDLVLGNLLFQRLPSGAARLVIIDGIGDVVKFRWLNRFPRHVRAKINRRWERFIRHVYRYPEVIKYLDQAE